MYATKLNLETKKIIALKKMIESIIEVHLPPVSITLLNNIINKMENLYNSEVFLSKITLNEHTDISLNYINDFFNKFNISIKFSIVSDGIITIVDYKKLNCII